MAEPGHSSWRRGAAAALTGAFLFNLGQGVLRPSLPVYLEAVFAANYRMVTAIPTAFAIGKWLASLPAGYLAQRFGSGLMAAGLLLLAITDIVSVLTSDYPVFLVVRGLAGVGWAMFGTVALTTMVDLPAVERRGRAVSALLMSETSGLLLGTAVGGWLFQAVGKSSPFVFEAMCMLLAAIAVTRWVPPSTRAVSAVRARRGLRLVLRTPGVMLMGVTNAVLIAVQTGVVVFLFPLLLVERGGMSPRAVGLVMSLGVLGRLLALWFGGGASDRWGRVRVLAPGLTIYAALLGTVTFVTHPVLLAVWSLGIGGASGVVAALPPALVGDRVPGAVKGVAIGWLRMMTDTGHIVGPLVMGALADAVNLPAAFTLAAVLLFGVAVGASLTVPERP